jgi:hypothetical protein
MREGGIMTDDEKQREIDRAWAIHRELRGQDFAASLYQTPDGDVVETPDEALAIEVALNEKDEEAREARRVRERAAAEEALKPQ